MEFDAMDVFMLMVVGRISYCSDFRVTRDGVWIDDRIYWTLWIQHVTTLYSLLLHTHTHTHTHTLVPTVTSSLAVAW
jgi:hypothetical protein